MPLPIFFSETIATVREAVVLNEDTSKHVAQVLRMREGELIQLTDGKGNLVTAAITDAHKKRTAVTITAVEFSERPSRKTAIAISLLKNAHRFEWFLEKATELGIQSIIPLICEHTGRQHFRPHRMQAVLVSAMLQSQQAWLPDLHEPVEFSEFLENLGVANKFPVGPGAFQKFIAHCDEEAGKKNLREQVDHACGGIVLIGPEGDFAHAEIELALQRDFLPVSLGDTRLRAETAGIVAATLLKV